MRHQGPVGTYIVIVCGFFNASLFPFYQPQKAGTCGLCTRGYEFALKHLIRLHLIFYYL